MRKISILLFIVIHLLVDFIFYQILEAKTL